MKRDTVRLWTREEYPYHTACGFLPRLDAYLHEDGSARPCVIVAPGGGYRRCSPSEGEPVALKFYGLGYQTFVCTYTTNLLDQEPLGLQPALDLARAVMWVRRNASRLGVDPKKVVLCGFSAGAHAVGTLGVHAGDGKLPAEGRPDAMILAYPVIAVFDSIAHGESSWRLLGHDPAREEREYMNLHRQVTPSCPPVFLWQTVTDGSVPMENSMMFAQSCRQAGVPFAYHLFSGGAHGLSLADDTAVTTAENRYTFEQVDCTVSALDRGEAALEGEVRQTFESYQEVRAARGEPYASSSKVQPEVQAWAGLAHQWMSGLFR